MLHRLLLFTALCTVAFLGQPVLGAALPDEIRPQVFDFAPGEVDGSAFGDSRPRWVTLGNVAYFAAFDPLHGHELWAK